MAISSLETVTPMSYEEALSYGNEHGLNGVSFTTELRAAANNQEDLELFVDNRIAHIKGDVQQTIPDKTYPHISYHKTEHTQNTEIAINTTLIQTTDEIHSLLEKAIGTDLLSKLDASDLSGFTAYKSIYNATMRGSDIASRQALFEKSLKHFEGIANNGTVL